MLTPVLKFSEIKKNPNIMVGLEQAAIVRYGDVMAYVVSPKRMEELLAAEEHFENGYLNGVADSSIGVGDTVRIKSLDKTHEEFGVTSGMLSIGDEAVINNAYDCQVCIGIFDYHIDDLELIK